MPFRMRSRFIKIHVQKEHIDTRFAQKAELSSFRPKSNELPDYLFRKVSRPGDS